MFTLSCVLVRGAWRASGKDRMDKVLTFHLSKSCLESCLSLCPLKSYLLWNVFGKLWLVFTAAAFPAVCTRFYSRMFLENCFHRRRRVVLLEVLYSLRLLSYLSWGSDVPSPVSSGFFILSVFCLKGNWRFLDFVYDEQRVARDRQLFTLCHFCPLNDCVSANEETVGHVHFFTTTQIHTGSFLF